MKAGQVITFYSYKGGVGRSFALANVAALLARWGWRVLCIDWDLEAPGLSYYLRPSGTQSPPAPQAGLLEMVEAVDRGENPGWTDYVTPVHIGEDMTLTLLAAGREDESYAQRVQAVNWEQVYVERHLGVILEQWRAEWMQAYDVVLVDSRAGINDIAGICAAQLPDVLVLVFTANQQSVDGVLNILDRARASRNKLPFDRPQLLTVPVPSRFDNGVEYERAEQWRKIFESRFARSYRDWAVQGLPLDVLIGHTTIPYSAYWSFGEDLPVLSESQREPSYLSYRFATLAALLIQRLENTELLVTSRDSYVDAAMRAGRRRAGFERDIFVSQTAETAPQARQLAQGLQKMGLDVIVGDDDLLAGEPWSDRLERSLDDSQHLVLVMGEKPSKFQEREAQYFLRQALDENSERRVIPVVATPTAFEHMPRFLRSFRAYDLSQLTGTEVTWEGAAAEISRAIGRNTGVTVFPGPVFRVPTQAKGVNAVAFSPDGTVLASAGWDGKVRLWKVVGGQQQAVLPGHTGAAYAVAFSPDGALLASGGRDGTVRLSGVAGGQQQAVLTGHTNGVRAVAFSPDGTRLASGSDDNTVSLWEVVGGRQLAVLTGHVGGGVNAVAFSPDGTLLASGGWDGTVRLWEAASGQQQAVLTGHTNGVRAVAFSPDGTRLASGSDDNTVSLWEAASGRQQAVLIGHTDRVTTVAFSPDGTRLASASDDSTVRLWEAVGGQQETVLTAHTSAVTAVAFSPDGTRLASASWDRTVRLWELVWNVGASGSLPRTGPPPP